MRSDVVDIEDPYKREEYVLAQLFEAMRVIAGQYGIAYRFRKSSGRTSHRLVFVSKHKRGYDVMKAAVVAESEQTDEGVPTYEFVEPDDVPMLFQPPPRAFPWTIHWLEEHLKSRYSRLTPLYKDIVAEDSIGAPYVDKNYRKAILNLKARGAVTLTGPDGREPRRGRCPPETRVHLKM